MVSLTVLLSFLVLSSPLCPIAQYTLTFQRTDNIIALRCRDDSTDVNINVERNRSVEFFVNRTFGDRIGPANLSEILHGMAKRLMRMDEIASFEIIPELEGYYSCGVSTPDSSPIKRFVSLRRSGLPENSRTDYAMQSSESGGSVTLLCPFEPGSLHGCYFGQWKKDSISIVTVRKPGIGTCDPEGELSIENNLFSKYQLDKETFSLTITSVEAANDNGNYLCELRVLDPASPVGATILAFTPRNISLTIDGEPSIVSGPQDVVVGAQDSAVKNLTSSAEFVCKVIGRPTPVIAWFYKRISNTGEIDGEEIMLNLGLPKVLNISSPENYTEESGRMVVTSRLMLSISEDDGGIIRCRAGSAYKDARLTVLGKPNIITTITKRGAPIIIDIILPVHIQYPVRLQISYSNETHTFIRRAVKPLEPYNDTSIITLREGRDILPKECSTACFIRVSLFARVGLDRVQGLSSDNATVDDNNNVCKEEEAETRASRRELMTCEQHKNKNMIIAIVVGVIAVIMIPAMIIFVLLACCWHRRPVKSKSEDETIELRNANKNLTQENNELTKHGKELKEVNENLAEENKDLTGEIKDLNQKIKDNDVCHEVDFIREFAEDKKKCYSNNPEIQEVFEKFIERAEKVIKIVCADTGSVGSRVERDDGERVQRIRRVMEIVNRELETII